MTKQHIVAILALLALLLGLYFYLEGQPQNPSVFVTPAEEARFEDATVITYQSETEDLTTVAYVGDLAKITEGEYAGTMLRQVEAASGAKYEGQSGLTLWTKGDEVRLETPQQVVFAGVAKPVVVDSVPPEPEEVVPVENEATTTATSTAATDSLLGSWTLRRIVTETGDIMPLQKPEAFVFTFNPDDTVSGDTDCNGFGGSYKVEGMVVTMSDLMQTEMYCEGMQEGEVTALLSGPLTFRVAGVVMTLVTANNVTLEFAR